MAPAPALGTAPAPQVRGGRRPCAPGPAVGGAPTPARPARSGHTPRRGAAPRWWPGPATTPIGGASAHVRAPRGVRSWRALGQRPALVVCIGSVRGVRPRPGPARACALGLAQQPARAAARRGLLVFWTAVLGGSICTFVFRTTAIRCFKICTFVLVVCVFVELVSHLYLYLLSSVELVLITC